MINRALKETLPHLIAVVILLLISVVFCKSLPEGNVLNQSDIAGWKERVQNRKPA